MAGLNLGEMFVQLGLDDSRFNRSITRSTNSLGNFGSKMNMLGRTAGTVFASISSVVAAASISFIKMASDATELRNVTEVTFGQSTDAINEWADNLSTKIGRSEQDILKFAGIAGANLRAIGFGSTEVEKLSKSITELSQDLSSFRNTSPEAAFQALMSGVSGSSIRPLRQFGVDIGEATLKLKAMELGLNDNLDALTQQEKIMLRMNVILGQTSFLQGDAENTVKKLANALKNLQGDVKDISVAIGNEMLPGVTMMVNTLAEFTELLKKVDFKKAFESTTIKRIMDVTKALLKVSAAILGIGIALAVLGNPLVQFGLIALTVVGAVKNNFLGLGDLFLWFRDEVIVPVVDDVIESIGEMRKAFAKIGSGDFSGAGKSIGLMLYDIASGLGVSIIKILEIPIKWVRDALLKLMEDLGTSLFKSSIPTVSKSGAGLLSTASSLREEISNDTGEIQFIKQIEEAKKEFEALQEIDRQLESATNPHFAQINADIAESKKNLKSFIKEGKGFTGIFKVATGAAGDLEKLLQKMGLVSDKGFVADFLDNLTAGVDTTASFINDTLTDAFGSVAKSFGFDLDEILDNFRANLKAYQTTLSAFDYSQYGMFDINDLIERNKGNYPEQASSTGAIAPPPAATQNLKSGMQAVAEVFTSKVPVLDNAISVYTSTLGSTGSQLAAISAALFSTALNASAMAPVMEKINAAFEKFANQLASVLVPLFDKIARAFQKLHNYVLKPVINAMIGIVRNLGKVLKAIGNLKIGNWKPFKKLGEYGQAILDNVQYIDEIDVKGLGDLGDAAGDTADSLRDLTNTIMNEIPQGLKLAFKEFSAIGAMSTGTTREAQWTPLPPGGGYGSAVQLEVTLSDDLDVRIANGSKRAAVNVVGRSTGNFLLGGAR